VAPLNGRKALGTEDGAALVEFAVVAPVMLLILLGIIDFGLLFQRYQVITNAAREGARVAVLPGYVIPDDVEERVTQFLTAAGLDEEADPPIVGAPVAVPLGTGPCVRMVSVTVSYPHSYSFIGGIASFFGGDDFTSTTLQATATMRNELAAAATCS
jgi:Flp pilus assembly protein TadG